VRAEFKGKLDITFVYIRPTATEVLNSITNQITF